MTIQDPVKFCAGLWDWSILDGCFGNTKIKLMDIDGFVERKGKKLYIETKSIGASIPMGEEISYKCLAKDSTVIFVWGNTNEPQKIRLLYGDKERIYDPANVELFRDIVKRWFDWANKDFDF